MGEKNLWFLKFWLFYINYKYNQLYFVLRLNNCYGWPATGQNRVRIELAVQVHLRRCVCVCVCVCVCGGGGGFI